MSWHDKINQGLYIVVVLALIFIIIPGAIVIVAGIIEKGW